MKFTGENVLARRLSSGSGTPCTTRPCWCGPSPAASGSRPPARTPTTMTVTAGVAAIKGIYAGTCRLTTSRSTGRSGCTRRAPARRARSAPTSRCPSPTRATAPPGHLRRRRGRRRHDRRRGAADADLGVASGWRRSSSATSTPVLGGAAPSVAAPVSPARARGRGRAAPSAPSSRRPAASGGRRVAGRLPPRAWRSGPGSSLAGVARSAPLVGRRRDERDLTVASTARAMAAAVADREISARELLDLHLARIAERNPRAQRDRLPRRGAGPCRGGRGRRGAGRGRRGRAAARAAVRVQGHPRGGRLAHDVRLAAARRPRPRARRAGRRADPPRGRRGDRQDQRAGVRRRLAHVQPGLRHHPQPRTTRAAPPAGPAAERRRPGHRGWCRWPTAPTWAARCATRRRSAASSACGPRSAGCRSGRTTTSGRRRRSAGRWRATSSDLALLLSVLAGPDPRAPLALGDPGSAFAPPLTGHLLGLRVALSRRPRRRLRGRRRASPPWCEEAGRTIAPPGAQVAAAHPDLAQADDTFRTLRAWHFQAKLGPAARRAPGRLQAVARRQHPRSGRA